MYDTEIRKKWDSSIKTLNKIEGNDCAYLLYAHYLSPIFFISERDVVDKRVEFTNDDVYYNISSSVEDEILPPTENVVRIRNYINLFIVKQDVDYFYFRGFNQIDMKVLYVYLDELT
jgi:hypothetical protein